MSDTKSLVDNLQQFVFPLDYFVPNNNLLPYRKLMCLIIYAIFHAPTKVLLLNSVLRLGYNFQMICFTSSITQNHTLYVIAKRMYSECILTIFDSVKGT